LLDPDIAELPGSGHGIDDGRVCSRGRRTNVTSDYSIAHRNERRLLNCSGFEDLAG
jgi:hypothetical protein